MNITTRRALGAAMLALPALRIRSATAQPAYPSRPIRFLAPYTPGGGVDTTARLLAGPMGTALGQTVVVENRPGAGGSLGAGELARSAPDGHTIMVDALAHVVNPFVLHSLPFDYATAFAPISQVVVLPQLLVVNPAKVPARNVAEFVTWAKGQRDLSYGSSGNATAAHLAAALFLQRTGLDIQHVPYRGGTAALQDVMGGSLAFVFGTVSSSVQLVRDGKLRALGVTTAQRIQPLPDVPTIAEQGFPGYELNEWNGLYAPAGTPQPIVHKLYEASKAALADATVKQRLEALGAIPVGTDPETFAGYVKAQRDAMSEIVRSAKIEVG
ncbi:Bug family tripartite tricarboxylate transporter substrate binding protein [Roseomonas xinghualingensis]|uniref:Bug family tripartite tricarboxylate transporter substrate binding protein n=1 Tax=Roseomonas xinghualingensis TaxID=2986475 RepID=UPI0021F1C929|nr:tripartite tricarboxylate transporter substrate-binding protein [Roseomonas sp. SXEYE001]MCV4207689.1 tripartite tricarboxylate transporter substrate-binding protein [Roseomonas sp. SXEYE001]